MKTPTESIWFMRKERTVNLISYYKSDIFKRKYKI